MTPHALRKEVLQYFAGQGGFEQHTAVFTHFALDPVDIVQETLDALFEEKLIDEQWGGVLFLTKKGEKALDRLPGLEQH